MCARKRRNHSVEFKKQAVRLSEDEHKTVKEVAERLGIKSYQLYQWRQIYLRKESEQQATSISTKSEDNDDRVPPPILSSDKRRVIELERKLKKVQMERDILKKAMILFSRNQDVD